MDKEINLKENEVLAFYLQRNESGYYINSGIVGSQNDMNRIREQDNFSHFLTNGWHLDETGENDYTKGGIKLYGEEYNFLIEDKKNV